MKKSFILFIFLIIFLLSGLPNLAMGQTSNQIATTTGNVVSLVKIKSASGFINDVKNLLNETWQKVAGSKRGEILAKIKNWFPSRQQAIKNGWQEEKREFSGNLKEIISNGWQKAKDKIKSWVFHK